MGRAEQHYCRQQKKYLDKLNKNLIKRSKDEKESLQVRI